jgi:heat shock protein HslJ
MITRNTYIIAALLLSLWSCQGGRKAQGSTNTPPNDPQVAALQRGTWLLQTYGSSGRPAATMPRTELTATFNPGQGQVSGEAGCNRFFATYSRQADSLQVGATGSTRMQCDSPAGVMQQETLYLTLLSQAQTFRVDSSPTETLFIDCSDGQVLVFTRP